MSGPQKRLFETFGYGVPRGRLDPPVDSTIRFRLVRRPEGHHEQLSLDRAVVMGSMVTAAALENTPAQEPSTGSEAA